MASLEGSRLDARNGLNIPTDSLDMSMARCSSVLGDTDGPGPCMTPALDQTTSSTDLIRIDHGHRCHGIYLPVVCPSVSL